MGLSVWCAAVIIMCVMVCKEGCVWLWHAMCLHASSYTVCVYVCMYVCVCVNMCKFQLYTDLLDWAMCAACGSSLAHRMCSNAELNRAVRCC